MMINFVISICLLACTKVGPPTPPLPPLNPCIYNGIDTCAANASLTANINLAAEKQTIHSFGASDCWGVKFIGENWPLEKRNQIADLLFSKDLDGSGNPKGIGLSMWRINVGAGSYEQGTGSKISSEWRREECFQNADGTYDWNKQAGNRWFAEAAKARGVENFLLFSIAPPVQMSKNGFAFGDAGAETGKLNLQSDKYDEFADFLTEVAKNYNQAGIAVKYISPLNEPQWDWTAKNNGEASQEGTSATNAEALQLIRELNTKIAAKSLTQKLVIGEVASHNYAFGTVADNPTRSDVINYFWNSSSASYLGSLNSVEKVISSHSYFSQPNLSSLISNRVNLANKIAAVNPAINYWQSEYCILSGEDNIAGNGRDLGMTSALYIARVIHSDLAVANASSWQWWLGISPSDYKDGLVYVADLNGNMGELPATRNDGLIYKSKMLWALGNYSRFVRPGMVRVDASISGTTDPQSAATKLMISAYKKADSKEVVVVVINMRDVEEKIKFAGLNFSTGQLKSYTTSDTKELQAGVSGTGDKIKMAPRSVTTFVGTYQ
jgi:O-glycosyl hydrolase